MAQRADMADESEPDDDRQLAAEHAERVAELRSESDSGDADAIDPADLDIARRDGVRERGEGRYVVSTNGEATETPPGTDLPNGDARDARDEPGDGRDHGGALERVDEAYGIALSAKTDSGTETTVATSNNIVEVFEEALRWYAGQVDDSLPPEEVVSLLLEQSDLDVES
ncbi:hypotheical protein [Halarchaeum acidiphilum MH1-52-1]|uniref:Hypotheical protein n=3 Tax=Halarchaeum acidiphilum TaxID=489138 RepID=U2YRG3_9EURY|nr:hypotheical protein [Halarchaeum acidiphilum MH1-52-1]